MTRPLWTLSELAVASGGTLAGEDRAIGGLAIDGRSVEAGDLFLALSGARDGHDFVAQALASGAVASLVSRPVGGAHVLVPDVFRALEQLAVASRERAGAARRAAITGSVGKTSVTRAVEAGLKIAGASHASVKSFNNHIGVPLTLARMPAGTERAVFEVGMNHADEIRPLTCLIRPHVAAITNVGPVHIENFPDGETGVMAAKAEIFEGLMPGGAAVLNRDSPWFNKLSARATELGARVLGFGTGQGADARLIACRAKPEGGQSIRLELHGKALTADVLQDGAHWGTNVLCVLLVLAELGVSADLALEALASFSPIEGRGAISSHAINGGQILLIDESYNANPVSMGAAIRTLGARPGAGRKVAVLTDMLELGEGSPGYHRDLAVALEAAGVDQVYCAGPLMASLFEALPSTRKGGYAIDAAQLVVQLLAELRDGDQVMVKGSNGSRAGFIAQAIKTGIPQLGLKA